MTARTYTPQPPKGYVRPQPLPVLDLPQADRIRRTGRCGACGGPLWIDPPEVHPGTLGCLLCSVVVAEVLDELPPERGPLPPEELHPKRGRPPKSPPAKPVRPLNPPPSHPKAYCPDCAEPLRRNGPVERCHPCAMDRRRARGLEGQLLAALRNEPPMKTRDLAVLLRCRTESLRQAIHTARGRGIPIVSVRGCYRLAEQAS